MTFAFHCLLNSQIAWIVSDEIRGLQVLHFSEPFTVRVHLSLSRKSCRHLTGMDEKFQLLGQQEYSELKFQLEVRLNS